MRLSCIYRTKQIPEAYQMMFVSLIKECLNKTDKEYYEKVYKYNNEKNNKKPKNFCFSVYMKGFEKEGSIFKIQDKVILNISSPDYEFILKVYNGLLSLKEFKYKDFSINKVKINLIKEKNINKNRVVFNTLSPMYIKDKNNNPVSIEDENYEKELNYITNESLKGYRGTGLKESLKFKPIKMKKKVVKENIRGFREKTNKIYCYVNSYSGIFELCGDVSDLQDIYMLGIGFKRGQGFGMLEFIE
ncbi:CRISPR-associated endoribonuclease Cas6 [Hathewaya limosa]|uniref:CRISPR-associated endoribonuclease Cas6 n=1 Tax=Hathewaya limosa TaxID=1536 RepID=A0ABU0JU11_HATLI|nr:CRISPR-associated endoribonuclease Cas6 [Hathewaya limosa]MDQ0480590.1 CRISPR-associated endoribonuclease Cas6 [Hathewaya limosa]